MTNDEQAIRNVIATWMRASTTGDNPTVLNLMSDDVKFLVPGRKPFGKEAFSAAQTGMSQFKMESKSNILEIRVQGDWAWVIADLVIEVTPAAGGQTVRRSGNTLSIFQKLPDGRWVLSRDANLLAVEKPPAK